MFNHNDNRSRRSFLRFFGLIFSAVGAARLLGQNATDSSGALKDTTAVKPKKQKVAITLEKLKKIANPGDSVILELKGRKILLVRKSKDEITALDTECKHKKCPVNFESGWDEIRCKCHGSIYNLQGEVQKGPSKENLMNYPAEIKDGKLILTLG